MMRTKSIRTLLVAIGAIVAVAACGPSIGADAEISIQRADGTSETVSSLDLLQNEIVFDITYLEGVPEGVKLTQAMVTLPPDDIAEESKNRDTRVLLLYENEDKTFNLQLQQSIGTSATLISDIEIFTVENDDGQSSLVQLFDGPEEGVFGAIWTVCRTQFVLSANILEGDFVKEWGLVIAKETLTDCS